MDRTKIAFHFPILTRMDKSLILVLCLLLASCSKKKENNTALPVDKINTVSVIIDDQLWNGEVGDSIRNKFASPVLGLPQEEPLFTLNQYPVKLLEGYMTNSRNIMVIKKEAKSQFRIEDNEYVKPQIVIHVSGRTVQEILDTIQANDSLISHKIRKAEIKLYQSQLAKDTLQDLSVITKKFNIRFLLPLKYKLTMKGRRFVWYKKEITSGSLSLLLYQLPLKSINLKGNVANRIIKIRDSIGKKYIHGTEPHTKMVTERAFSPYFSKTTIYGKEAFESKGSWEVTHDNMSGPFVSYTIIDKANNRVLILEGFCYAPSKPKRDLMFELESMIKSIQFLKKK